MNSDFPSFWLPTVVRSGLLPSESLNDFRRGSVKKYISVRNPQKYTLEIVHSRTVFL